MPFPPPVRTLSGPRRRTLLASAAGAALLAGCSSGEGDAGRKTSDDPSVSAQEPARARAAADSAGLVERYDAVLAVHPALAARLAPLRAEVVRHVTAFGGAEGGAKASPSASAPASAPASASVPASVPAPVSSAPASASASASGAVPSASSTVVPATAKGALADLAGAERTLADRRIAALADVPGELARLLASVAAAGAAHAYLLTEGDR
ncbi:hypothetical protein AB0N31_30040 [Streptomyces sp. NPDC051051]|uniref:hypothetical protein n=1 Tax=Streptomyces sp. NPDC051051 TaxID=3155666 RepID=UPI003426F7FB